jgi:hypothetical protein
MLKNQRGLAVFEVIPVLAIFILLLNFVIGFFGAIHSGILNSIAARNYSFETFRNRANLNYLRDEGKDLNFFYNNAGQRWHSIKSEGRINDAGVPIAATRRAIKFSEALDTTNTGEADVHNKKVARITASERASDIIESDEFSKIWIRVMYGICVNRKCGD